MTTSVPPSPPARRLRQPSWLDLRVVLGLLLVVVSVLAGARVVAAADRSQPVWAVTQDLAAGTVLTPGDLSAVRLRLSAGAERYLQAGSPPTGRALSRDVGAGELLPRSAVIAEPPGQEISLPVSALHVPESLRRGQRVDVFGTVGGAGTGTAVPTTVRVLTGVPVQDVRRPRGTLAGAGGLDLAVVVRVAPEQAAEVVRALRGGALDIAVAVGSPAAPDGLGPSRAAGSGPAPSASGPGSGPGSGSAPAARPGPGTSPSGSAPAAARP